MHLFRVNANSRAYLFILFFFLHFHAMGILQSTKCIPVTNSLRCFFFLSFSPCCCILFMTTAAWWSDNKWSQSAICIMCDTDCAKKQPVNGIWKGCDFVKNYGFVCCHQFRLLTRGCIHWLNSCWDRWK